MQGSFKRPPIGGINRDGEVDKISIQNAVLVSYLCYRTRKSSGCADVVQ